MMFKANCNNKNEMMWEYPSPTRFLHRSSWKKGAKPTIITGQTNYKGISSWASDGLWIITRLMNHKVFLFRIPQTKNSVQLVLVILCVKIIMVAATSNPAAFKTSWRFPSNSKAYGIFHGLSEKVFRTVGHFSGWNNYLCLKKFVTYLLKSSGNFELLLKTKTLHQF